jgi:type VI secretion system protein
MAGRGLLARLQQARGPAGSRPLDETDAIIEHLRALLNTRQGEGPTAPEFGILDFTDLVHAFPESIQTLQRAIRATVLRYEPRLKNVVVRHLREDDQVLALHFEITAELARTGARGVLRFQTRVTPGGRVDVR